MRSTSMLAALLAVSAFPAAAQEAGKYTGSYINNQGNTTALVLDITSLKSAPGVGDAPDVVFETDLSRKRSRALVKFANRHLLVESAVDVAGVRGRDDPFGAASIATLLVEIVE